jgi:tetratricopeptide (TPR) repeat protein/precorrin-6B methylase 2
VGWFGSLRNIFSKPTPAQGNRDDAAPGVRALPVLAKVALRQPATGSESEALQRVDELVAMGLASAEMHFMRAQILMRWGRSVEAMDALLVAERGGLRTPEFLGTLGWARFDAGEPAAAESMMRESLTIGPESSEAHYALAMTLYAQHRLADAGRSFRRALELDPASFDGWHMLGNCVLEQGDAFAAEACFRKAIEIGAGRAMAWKDLAVALGRLDRYDESLEALERAVELASAGDPADDSFVNLAICLVEHGRTPEALALLERCLPTVPSIDGHYAYANALLTVGRMEEGWEHYEFRWLTVALHPLRAGSRRPAWTGQDLTGKTILLRVEQGLGDDLQFLRYARHVKALGPRVLLKNFDPIAKSIAGVDHLIGDGETPDYDYYVNLMSLPRIFGTTLECIPAVVPYVAALPERSARWAPRLQSNATRKVGLVWAGSPTHPRDRYRSIPLASLAPLGAVPAIAYFALQKGTEGLKGVPPGLTIQPMGPELNDLADTAAVIEQLDLVISVDTSVAHLAGALGKPVWLLLPRPIDWRWMEDRTDSPWYPSMRIFRQGVRGDWAGVIERVLDALMAHVGSATSADPPSMELGSTTDLPPAGDAMMISRMRPGQRSDLSAVAETRCGILQYQPAARDIGPSVDRYGEWLQQQVDLVTSLLQRGATVLEAGAGIGAHSVPLGLATAPDGHLMVFENDPVCRKLLQQNLAANGVRRVTLMRRGLSATADDESETVDSLRLQRLDMIKVSGPGYTAPAVIEGAAETLWRLRPMLHLSVSDEREIGELQRLAEEYGYRIWRHDTALFNPANFNGRRDDIFEGRKVSAILAVPEELNLDHPLAGCIPIVT